MLKKTCTYEAASSKQFCIWYKFKQFKRVGSFWYHWYILKKLASLCWRGLKTTNKLRNDVLEAIVILVGDSG